MRARVLTFGLTLSLSACGASSHDAGPNAMHASDAGALAELPWEAVPLPPVPYPADNPASDAKRELGRLLFYDPIVSSDRATACVTCHSEEWGLGDQLARSVGIEGKGPIGPGRVGPNMTRRNAQSLWNVAYKERLFWDGRASTLEEQALKPLEAPEELNREPAEVVREIASIPAYVRLFEAAFPGEKAPVSVANFAKALATFVRAYASDHAPYDAYLQGKSWVLSPADLRGMALFAELGCHDCHVPPRFENERYEDRHVPNPESIADDGRFEASRDPADRHKYRVPTLRNVRGTGPYFHNGSVATLEEAVQHELEQQRALGHGRALSASELSDLLSFIRRALVDQSREQFRPRSVPSGLMIPPDGDRLVRGVHD